jgi:23S rRNA pseudouridine2457 synthase
MKLILFNKPFNVMSQFSAHPKHPSLADFLSIPNIYPAGRLDADSEGLMLLTDHGGLQNEISHPKRKQLKSYLVQVEGLISETQLEQLKRPINLGDFTTQESLAVEIAEPEWLWPRNPPVRQRLSIPTSWLSLSISEGKNRQVRRMTAAVGLPTLRLIRHEIAGFSLFTHPIFPGDYLDVSSEISQHFPHLQK